MQQTRILRFPPWRPAPSSPLARFQFGMRLDEAGGSAPNVAARVRSPEARRNAYGEIRLRPPRSSLRLCPTVSHVAGAQGTPYDFLQESIGQQFGLV